MALISIFGGVALMLWGCRMIRTGMMRAFGTGLQNFLGGVSNSRWRSVVAGVGVGAVLQSSTATALLVSPFVGHGAIRTTVALAMMLGADLGSAIAAGIFSIGISAAWPALAFAGYLLHAANEAGSNRLRHVGRMLLGLGLLFLGLSSIGSVAGDISASPITASIIQVVSSDPLLSILIGAALTWAAHSSIAIILLVVAIAGSAGTDASQFFPLVLGVNIGAALPAMTATMSDRPAIRRVPLGNLLFRICGAALALPALSVAGPAIGGLELDPARQIIVAHLAFNGALCLFFAGLTGPVAWITARIVPDIAGDHGTRGAQHLDAALLETPGGALGAATREALRMGGLIEEMLSNSMMVFENDDPALRRKVESADDEVDELHQAIKLYLIRLMNHELDGEDTARAVEIIGYATNLEHVGDIIDKNLMELAGKKRRLRLQFSDQGLEEIRELHAQVMKTLQLSLNVFMHGSNDAARALLASKMDVRQMEIAATDSHLERLRTGEVDSMMTSAIHVDVLRDFKRINSHLTAVAYPVLDRAGELRESRLKAKPEREAALPG